jgi:hypothetical protein
MKYVTILYEENDKKWVDRIKIHLKPLIREKLFELLDNQEDKTTRGTIKELTKKVNQVLDSSLRQLITLEVQMANRELH